MSEKGSTADQPAQSLDVPAEIAVLFDRLAAEPGPAVEVPVWLRVATVEAQVGTVEVDEAGRADMPRFLRALADAWEEEEAGTPSPGIKAQECDGYEDDPHRLGPTTNPPATAAIIRTVALALRQIADWAPHALPTTPQEWYDLAAQVENLEPGWCCPMCEEVTCDEGCPLELVRANDSAGEDVGAGGI